MITREKIYQTKDEWFDSLEGGTRAIPLIKDSFNPLWIQFAIEENRMRALEILLDVQEVPKCDTVKDRLALYYLLKG